PDSRHLIEVKATATKGLGVFATADILRGTRVIAETALLNLPTGDGCAKEVIAAFQSLSPAPQNSYLELRDSGSKAFKERTEGELGVGWYELPKLDRKVLAICVTNRFGKGGVFLLGSRINHSCVPNIHGSYNDALEKSKLSMPYAISRPVRNSRSCTPLASIARGASDESCWMNGDLCAPVPHVRTRNRAEGWKRNEQSYRALIKNWR
ncbi:hypothetical protein BDW02DRAFT_93547, partial [Decorospora gaudefroyi]